jgi:hypothetical protein
MKKINNIKELEDWWYNNDVTEKHVEEVLKWTYNCDYKNVYSKLMGDSSREKAKLFIINHPKTLTYSIY